MRTLHLSVVLALLLFIAPPLFGAEPTADDMRKVVQKAMPFLEKKFIEEKI